MARPIEVREPRRWRIAGLLIVAILTAGGMRLARSWLYPPPKSASLTITSKPEGATVTLDNKVIGLTPVTAIRVKPGEHSLKLEKYRYQVWSRPVAIRGESPVLRIRLRPSAFGSVRVASDPAQSEVFLDGSKRGFTPLLLEEVPPGKHELRLTKPGFRPALQAIHVLPAQELKVAVNLQSQTEEFLLAEIKRNPKELLNYIELLHIYIVDRKLDKAKATFLTALRMWTAEGADPDTAARLDQEVRKAYFAEYDVGGDEALEPLRASLESAMEEVAFAPAGAPGQGGSAPVGLALASICEAANKLDKARATYEKLLSLRSGDVDVKRAYGFLLLRLQLMPEAAKVLGEVAQARPSDVQVHQALGGLYLALNRTDEGVKALLRVTELEGATAAERIAAETQLAGVFHSQQNFAKAAERWEKAWPLAETPDQQAELQLAAAAEQKLAGNPNRAKELYQQVLNGGASAGLKDRAKEGVNK